jgi:uncharacterized protein (TIGR02271 family)
MEIKPNDPQIVIPVIEEQLQVSKVWQETGRVQISKTVTEEAVDFNLPVSQEEVIMERIPINEYVDIAPPASRYEGDTLIIPVIKEVLVVEKKLMLVEELHIIKRKTEQMVSGTEILRKESVTLERSHSNTDITTTDHDTTNSTTTNSITTANSTTDQMNADHTNTDNTLNDNLNNQPNLHNP